MYLYKANEYVGNMKTTTDDGKYFLLEKDMLNNYTLIPHIDEYLQVFENGYSECFCTYKDGCIPHYR